MEIFTVLGFILVALVAIVVFPRLATLFGISVLLSVWGIAFNSKGTSVIPDDLNGILSVLLFLAMIGVGYIDVVVFKKLRETTWI